MDAERDRAAQRGAVVLPVKPLIVDAVACFMQDAEEALVEMLRMIAGGNPAIARSDASAKRMGGDIEPAGAEVEADGRSRRLPENFLACHWIISFEDAFGSFLARGGDGSHQ